MRWSDGSSSVDHRPTAVLLGGLFLGEVLAPRDFAGMALIALGLAAIDGGLLARLRRPVPA